MKQETRHCELMFYKANLADFDDWKLPCNVPYLWSQKHHIYLCGSAWLYVHFTQHENV